MGVLLAKPSELLAPWVRCYALRSAHVGSDWVHFPLPARSDCFLEFYLRDRYRVITVATGAMHFSPDAVVVGPHTERLEDLVYSGNMLVLNVEFTAVGLRALTGLSPKEIADRAVEACTIFGSGIQRLHEELSAHGESLQKMAASVEIFLLKRLAAARIMPHIEVASSIARMFERSGGTVDVSVVADRFSLSTRQLERTFQEHVGIGPKTFAKLQRLNRALRLKGAEPALTWAEIAATCGYFDQAHLGRDFRMMTNETPVRFAALSSIGKNLWKSQRK